MINFIGQQINLCNYSIDNIIIINNKLNGSIINRANDHFRQIGQYYITISYKLHHSQCCYLMDYIILIKYIDLKY